MGFTSSFNRTVVELKPAELLFLFLSEIPFNRTVVELKLSSSRTKTCGSKLLIVLS